MSEIPINLVFEDRLSGSVLSKLVRNSRRHYLIGATHDARGFGWIKHRIDGFNNAAKGMPYLVLTDLDRCECPPALVGKWLSCRKHPNLLFRVAVKQVESWLLACRESFARYLGISEDLIPLNVERIPNSKRFVVDLARRSRRKRLREDIVPKEGSTAKVGPDYNGRLMYFVEHLWEPSIAKHHSVSLNRTMEILDEFRPVIRRSS